MSLRSGIAFLLRRVADLVEPAEEAFPQAPSKQYLEPLGRAAFHDSPFPDLTYQGGISRSHLPAELSPEGQRMIDRDAIRAAARAQYQRATATGAEDDMDQARASAAGRRSTGVR